MIKKTIAWIRVLLILSALLLGEVHTVLGADTFVETESASTVSANPGSDPSTDPASVSPSDPAPALADPIPEGPNANECMIGMMGAAVSAVPSGGPVTGMDYFGATTDPGPHVAGYPLKILVVIENKTAEGSAPCGPGLGKVLTDVSADIIITDTEGQAPAETIQVPMSPKTLNPGDIAWTLITYIIPANFEGNLHIHTNGAAEAGDIIPNVWDVLDVDDFEVTLEGPGIMFSVVPDPSLAPDYEASRGESVMFRLTLTNIRPGTTIADVQITEFSVPELNNCDGLTNWVPSGNLAYGNSATCEFTLTIPQQALTPYTVSGILEATDLLGKTAAQEFTSEPALNLVLPSVSVAKEVIRITREGQDVPLPGPARPGDVITYEIVIVNGPVRILELEVVDSLTGPFYSTTPLEAGGTLTLPEKNYTVRPSDPDPLVNTVNVTALPEGFSEPVTAKAAASVDLIDSSLEVTLAVEDVAGDPVTAALVGTQIYYSMTLRNLGSTPISNLAYSDVSPMRTVGEKPAISPTLTLPPNGSITLQWPVYTITDTDADQYDPLVSAVKIQGRTNNETVYGQSSVSVDIVKAGLNFNVTVVQPSGTTTAVLRGENVIFDIAVQNTSSDPGDGPGGPNYLAASLCDVVVSQKLRDPVTGVERTIIASVPLTWEGGVPGRIGPQQTSTATTTYEVGLSDKDPLDMIFEVQYKKGCPSGESDSDRTRRVFDISDVQIDASLTADLGVDGVAQLTDPPIPLSFGATNVGSTGLDSLTATYCALTPESDGSLSCLDGDEVSLPDPDPNSMPGYSLSTGLEFTYTLEPTDINRNPLVIQLRMLGEDDKGNTVEVRVSTQIPIATPDVVLEITGPASVVVGDTRTYNYSVRNASDLPLTNAQLRYPTSDNPTGYLTQDIGAIAIDEVKTGTFEYTIRPNIHIQEDLLTLNATVVAQMGSGEARAVDIFQSTIIPLFDVQKTGPETVMAGENFEYGVTFLNQSEDQTVTVTSYVDTVLSAYGGSLSHADFRPWPDPAHEGTLLPGQSVTGTYEIVDVSPDIAVLVNVFTVTANTDNGPLAGTPVSGSAEFTVQVSCPVAVTFVVDSQEYTRPWVLGQTLDWEIYLQNISDYDSITVTTINESLNEGVLSTTLPVVLAKGAAPTRIADFSKQITIEYFPGTSYDNYMSDLVSMEFSGAGTVTNCPATEWLEAVWSPVGLIKIADPTIAFTGDTVAYTIEMWNRVDPRDEFQNGYGHDYTLQLYDSLLSPDQPIPLDYDHDGDVETSGVLHPGDDPVSVTRTRVVEDIDPDTLVNRATGVFPVPGAPGTTFYVWNEAEVVTSHPLTVVKTATPAQATPGDPNNPARYSYRITNVSLNYVVEVTSVFDDVLNRELLDSGPITLNPLDVWELNDVEYLIPVDALDPLVNVVTVQSNIPSEGRDLPDVQASAQIDLLDPDLTITKWAQYANDPFEILTDEMPAGNLDGLPEGEAGRPIDYCFEVENQNTSNTTYVDQITVEDPGLGVDLQPLFEAAVIALGHPVSESRRLYGTEVVQFCAGVSITLSEDNDPAVNTVSLRGMAPNNVEVYNESELRIDVRGTNVLITKTVSDLVAPVGKEVTYTIRIENRNVIYPITVGSVEETFEGGVFAELPLAAFTWSSGTVGLLGANGGHATYEYTYTIQRTDPDPLINLARVSGILDDGTNTPVLDTTQAALAITSTQLIVRKTATPSVALPGTPVRYLVAVQNIGTSPVSDLTIVDDKHPTIPALPQTTLGFNDATQVQYTITLPTEAELAADPTLDPYINTVTVEGTIYDSDGNPIVIDPNPTTTIASATVDILQPDIRISKTPQVQAATQGEPVQYEIRIENTGDSPLTDLALTDEVEGVSTTINLATFTYVGAGGNYSAATGLPAGESLVGMVTVQIPEDFEGTEFTNIARIAAEMSPSGNLVSDSTSATIDIRNEGILVTKTPSVLAAPVGASVAYTIEVTNIGDVPVTELRISDPVLPGSPVIVTGPFPDTHGGTSTLDPEEVYTHPIYSYTLTDSDPDPFVNVATVTAVLQTTGALIIGRGQAEVDIERAEINVEKTVCVGQDDDSDPQTQLTPCSTNVNLSGGPVTVTYYLHFSNPGPVPVLDITVDDTLTGPITTITWPYTGSGGRTGLAAAGDPGNLDELWIMYEHVVQLGDPDPLENTVIATAAFPNEVQDTDSASLDLLTSDLLLTKTVEAPYTESAQVGNTVTYRLTVTNTNADPVANPITNVDIVDPLSPSGPNPLCTILSLADTPQTCTFEYTILPTDTSPLVNMATATDRDDPTVQDTATHELNIVTAGLTVTKTAQPGVARIGDPVTFTYVITNTSGATLMDVAVVESDPLLDFAADPWQDNLPRDGQAIRTLTRTMTATDPDPYTNTVTVTATLGGNTLTAQATETVYLSDDDLVVTNTANRTFAIVGDPVTFTYTIHNASETDTLTDLSISDGLCDTATLNGPLTTTSLVPGASVMASCTVTAALPGPIISNLMATATGTSGTLTDTATVEVPVSAGELLITKEANRATAELNDSIEYTVVVTNVGTATLTGVNVVDATVNLLPAPPLTLGPDESFTMTGELLVAPADVTAGVITNTATVTATIQGSDPVIEVEESASVSVAIIEAGDTLALSQLVTPIAAPPNTDVTYTFRVQNVGSDTVDNINLTYDPGDTGTPLTIVPSPALSLEPGGVAIFTVPAYSTTYTIPADYVLPELNNTARVFSDMTELDDATTTVTVQLLSLEKDIVSGSYQAGGPANYTFTVTNHSTAQVTGVTLTDAGVTFDPAFPTSFDPGTATPITGTGMIPTDAGATYTNTAQILVNGIEVDEDSVDINLRSLMLTKTPANPTAVYEPGDTILYNFTLENLTDAPITDLTFEDNDTTFVFSTLPDHIDAGVPPITFTGTGYIPANWTQLTYTNTARVLINGDLAHEVTSDPVNVRLVRLDKAPASAGPFQPGDPIAYNFTLTNLTFPPQSLTGLSFEDDDTTFAFSGNPTEISTDVVTFTGTGLIPANWAQPTYTNTARVLIGTTVMDEVTSAPVDVQVLELTKVGVPQNPVEPGNSVLPGGRIDYTFTVTNHSAAEIDNVTIDDDDAQITSGLSPMPIPAGGTATGTGSTFVPDPYAGATFNNTAEVQVGGVVFDTATASVPVAQSGGIEVTINGIRQQSTTGQWDLSLIQTGEPARVFFTITNTGTSDITNPVYAVAIEGNPGATCARVSPQNMPTTLAAGTPLQVVCQYIPPIGRDNNANLTPDVTVAAAGRAGSRTVNDYAIAPMELVDLQLQILLTISPSNAAIGSSVAYNVSLTNIGASSIGCNETVAADAACHIDVVAQDSVLNNLLAPFRNQIANYVLVPGQRVESGALARTLVSGDQTTTHVVVVDGGYYSAALATNGLLGNYIAHAQRQSILTVLAPALQVTIAAQPNPPVYNQTVTYTVSITNTGTFDITNLALTYQISPIVGVPAGGDGIMLVDASRRPQQQGTGSIAVPTNIAVGQTVTGTLAKTEDQTRAYTFLANVTGTGVSNSGAVNVRATLDLTPSNVSALTPTPTGTITATVDPNTLDPTATEPTVTKTVNVETAQAGSAVTWTVTVRNGSTNAMAGVTLKDPVPDTLTIDSVMASSGSSVVEGQTVTLAAGTMNPGDTVTITISTTVTSAVTSPSSIVNTACAMRDGGTQVCGAATVNIGPGVGGLPATGVTTSSGPGGMPWFGLLGIGLLGALMLLMGAETSNRRVLIAVVFLLVAITTVIAAVVLLVSGDDEDKKESPEAGLPAAQTSEVSEPAGTPEPGGSTVQETSAPVVLDDFPPSPTPYIVPTAAGPRYISIPKLADSFEVPVPIVNLPLTGQEWDVSGLGYYVGWLEGTTWMDPQWGNTVLAAHVQLGFQNPGPFWGLGDLVPGDEILVTEGDLTRSFEVISVRKVDPNDWTVTAPTSGPTLTLITCTEWDQSYGVFSKRMVVQAVPTSNS